MIGIILCLRVVLHWRLSQIAAFLLSHKPPFSQTPLPSPSSNMEYFMRHTFSFESSSCQNKVNLLCLESLHLIRVALTFVPFSPLSLCPVFADLQNRDVIYTIFLFEILSCQSHFITLGVECSQM